MKKLILSILLVISLFLLIGCVKEATEDGSDGGALAGQAVGFQCDDSDGGRNSDEGGVVTVGSGATAKKYSDRCIRGKVQEVFCGSNAFSSVSLDCNAGKTCVDADGPNAPLPGACVTPQVCGNGIKEGTEQCDGVDLGDATCYEETTDSVACTSTCTLDMSGCVARATCTTKADCPADNGCKSGTCTPLTCVDPKGSDSSTKETVTVTYPDGTIFSVGYDDCSGVYVAEQVCNFNTRTGRGAVRLTCLSGATCLDGACVAS